MRQFVLICNEDAIAAFQKTFNVQFVEVQGIPTQCGRFNLMATPVPQPPEKPVEAVQDFNPEAVPDVIV